MTTERSAASTPYGMVDGATLGDLRQTYDTSGLLRMVDELDALVRDLRDEDGLRDMLLRLHGMAHTVINGAGMSVASDGDELPEVAFDTIAELQRTIAILKAWVATLEPLERLTPRN